MERNTRIIIGAVLILFIAMVSFRFETLTGFAEKEFDSAITFDVWPDEVNLGEKVFIDIETNNYLSNKGGMRSLCILKEDTRVTEFCTRMLCPGDSKNSCQGNSFDIRTNSLDAGENYILRVWEYPKNKIQQGKFIYGGEFTIKPEIKKLSHENIYDTGKILGE